MALSESSERLKTLAVEEARRLGHRYVGTEHLLLALCRDPESRASAILIQLDLEPEDLQEQVDAFVISGDSHEEQDIPFSPRAQRALDRAIEEASTLGAPRAEPEHVLLALAEDEEDVSARVLEVFGIDRASVLQFVRSG